MHPQEWAETVMKYMGAINAYDGAAVARCKPLHCDIQRISRGDRTMGWSQLY